MAALVSGCSSKTAGVDPDTIFIPGELGLTLSHSEIDSVMTACAVAYFAGEYFVAHQKWPTHREELIVGAKPADRKEASVFVQRLQLLRLIQQKEVLVVTYKLKTKRGMITEEFTLAPGTDAEEIVLAMLKQKEPNQPVQPTPGTGPVSNFESPARRG